MKASSLDHSNVEGSSPGGTRTRQLIKLLALVLFLAVAVLVAWRLGFFALRDPRRLAAAIRQARQIRGIGPLFVVAYALIATLGLPAFPLTLAGGAMFGLRLGSLLSWGGAVAGACGAYGLARLLGRDALRSLIGRWGEKLNVVGERSGFAAIFRLRLIAVVPFNLVSIASGLAGVRFRSYAAATALGIIPGVIIYTYFADSLVAGVEGASRKAFTRLAIAAVILLAVSFAPAVVKRFGARPSEPGRH